MNIFGPIKNSRRLVCIVAAGVFVFSFAMFAHGAGIRDPNHNSSKYSSLMREVNELKAGKGDAIKKAETVKNLDEFISGEKARLDDLGVSGAKQKVYFKTLESQLKAINDGSAGEKSFFSEWFGVGDEQQNTVENKVPDDKIPEFKIPPNPGRFKFADPRKETIKTLKNIKIAPQSGQKIPNSLLKLVEKAQAVQVNVLPQIEDIRADDKEVNITPEIRQLANSLHNNPVEITNFVRNSVTFEPYFGAKKGNIGCLHELVCNDVDVASLTISLLRVSGIPARYKKSAAIFSVKNLKNILGVDETKTIVAIFLANKFPVYTLNHALDGVTFENSDFSNETHLILEWTHIEAFYDYDENGGNINNELNLNSAADTAALRALLQTPKKQWIPIDVIVKQYSRSDKPILADVANFNIENFWNSFLEYQGNLSPLAKYEQDIANATGQQISQNLSKKSSRKVNFEILPITLPFFHGINVPINEGAFSILPDLGKNSVKISLRKENGQEILAKNFFGSEINNVPLNIYYEGAQDVDRAVVEQHGGIHATPAALVDIIPYLQTESAKYEGIENGDKPTIQIGETLIFKAEYFINGESLETHEKFSTAGNQEGVYIILSKVQKNAFLDNLQDENHNSHLLLEGNTALAREHLRTAQEDLDIIKKSLNHESNIQFGIAIVTQSRILSEVDGMPTTFDFKGLTVDSGAYIADYSNVSHWDTHLKDFRLLLGEQMSYSEAQLFKDVAGLNSIAAIQGIQYAYAHPDAYTVHRITAANAGEIDQLQLSDNTKANMRTDVAAGNTIITPNKLVETGIFRGTLYVSYDMDGNGRYAIGEQTGQNGGWTTVLFNGVEIGKFLNEGAEDNFIYSESIVSGDKKCRISKEKFLSIGNNSNNEGWDPQYGLPCFAQTPINFGDVTNTFILATDGAKFYSPGNYEGYWVKESDVQEKINQYITEKSNLPANDRDKLVIAERYNNFRFSTSIGTYLEGLCSQNISMPGKTVCADSKEVVIYYSPYNANNIKGRIFRAKEGFLTRLSDAGNSLLYLLGFPKSDEVTGTSRFGASGTRQDFANGQLFWISKSNGVYYTYGKLTDKHKESGNIEGELGYPTRDPKTVEGLIYQLFEDDNEIIWDTTKDTIVTSLYKKYQCLSNQEIGDRWYDGATMIKIQFEGAIDSLFVDIPIAVKDSFLAFVNGVINYNQTIDEVKQICNELAGLNIPKIREIVKNKGSAVSQTLLAEWNDSFGKNGCEARQWYVEGRMAGMALGVYFSEMAAAKTLSLLSKIKLFKYFKLIRSEAAVALNNNIDLYTANWDPKPWKIGSMVNTYKTTSKVEGMFIRVHLEDNQIRKFFMLKEDIQGLNKTQIIQKFALPYDVDDVLYFSKLKIPVDVEIRSGLVQHRAGEWLEDVQQFEFSQGVNSIPSEWFDIPQAL